ncbi:MAG TPA: hypothetical protein VMD30_02500 [Tepidisphaeraceae bacterium]|nr:hypothetical protein [Tepidisphaeraceae bacterium]
MTPRMSEPEERTDPTSEQSPSGAADAAGRDVRQLLDYVSLFISAKIDAIRALGRSIALLAALGVAALIIGAGVLAAAGVMIVLAAARGFSELFGMVWLGDLVAGLIFIILFAGGALIAYKVVTARAYRNTRAKYEKMRKFDGRES